MSIIVNGGGKPKEEILPIEKGGTNASTTTQARENLGFTYSDIAPTTTPDTGEGSVCFVLDDGSPTPIEEGGTNAVTAQEAIQNLGMYPVGSVYITDTNTNPATYLGGTWKLVEKHFKRQILKSTDVSGLITKGNYCNDCTFYFMLDGQTIHVSGSFSFTTTLLTTNLNVGTIDFTKIGCSQLRVTTNAFASSDSAAGVAYLRMGYGDGILVAQRFIPSTDGASLPAETTLNCTFSMFTGDAYMDDAFCDKFFWKRTA